MCNHSINHFFSYKCLYSLYLMLKTIYYKILYILQVSDWLYKECYYQHSLSIKYTLKKMSHIKNKKDWQDAFKTWLDNWYGYNGTLIHYWIIWPSSYYKTQKQSISSINKLFLFCFFFQKKCLVNFHEQPVSSWT